MKQKQKQKSTKKKIMVNLEDRAEMFFKQSIIGSIIVLAEKIRGRESVTNLIQYKYDEMIKHSYAELESIRDSHLKVYNKRLLK
tara:strand:- start:476 stop:727 length:252 start_codon:yes stop_codon:yes gene_type:complete